jgi:hypothetical protein
MNFIHPSHGTLWRLAWTCLLVFHGLLPDWGLFVHQGHASGTYSSRPVHVVPITPINSRSGTMLITDGVNNAESFDVVTFVVLRLCELDYSATAHDNI